MEKEELFDPSKYSHLSKDTTLEDWVSEFLSRNEQFLADLERMPNAREENATVAWDDFYEKYGIDFVQPPSANSPLKVKISPVRSLRMIGMNSPSLRRASAMIGGDMDEPWTDKLCRTPWHISPQTDLSSLARHLLGHVTAADLSKQADLLLVAIDLSRPREGIDHYLKRLLSIQKPSKAKQPRTRRVEWKRYLMVYDLRQTRYKGKPMPHEKILNLIRRHVRNAGLSSEEAVRKDYGKAKALIHGGYMEHL